jgi:hypothetical protein
MSSTVNALEVAPSAAHAARDPLGNEFVHTRSGAAPCSPDRKNGRKKMTDIDREPRRIGW